MFFTYMWYDKMYDKMIHAFLIITLVTTMFKMSVRNLQFKYKILKY